MEFKSSKKKKASRQIYEASRDYKRTRKGGKHNLEHLHAELLVARERIVELRHELDQENAQTKVAKLLLSNLDMELSRVADSCVGPNRILRQISAGCKERYALALWKNIGLRWRLRSW